MKITRIKLNCRDEAEMKNDIATDPVLFHFKSPVVFNKAGRRIKMKGSTAAVFTSGYMQNFQPASESGFCCDYVIFRMSAGDKQYLASCGLPLDEPIAVADDYIITELLRCMKAQSMHSNKDNAEFLELSMRMIFIALNESQSAESTRKVPHLAKLKRIREAIYAAPEKKWESDLLADEMDISRAYFHRIYLAAFGVTCRQDVIESRLQYAAELLRDKELTLSDVAEKCGYESDSYFMRQFKKHRGCTPTEYRMSLFQEK